MEEAKGLFAGRGGEADEVGVEVFQHLCPEVVDGAVAFVGDDDVEGFDGDSRIVVDGFGLFVQRFEACGGDFIVFVGEFFAFEHGEHALDGADADPRGGVERVAAEALDDEFFGEFEIVIRGDVLLEFFEGLVAQVAAIYQE